MKTPLVLCCACLLATLSIPAFAANPIPLWVVTGGGNSTDVANAVAIDAAGNVYVGGYITGPTNLGGISLVPSGTQDAFIAKLSPSGTVLWAKNFGGTPGSAAVADCASIALDKSGNVYFTGYFNPSINLGGSTLNSVGGYDFYVARFTSGGTHAYSIRYGGTGDDLSFGIAFDPLLSNLFVTGSFQTSITFNVVLNSAGSSDIFIARLGNILTAGQSIRAGDTGVDAGLGVAVDSGGNVYATGYFNGNATFGGGTLTSAGGNDVYLVKFTSSLLAHQWSQRFGSTLEDTGYDLALDASSNVYITGVSTGNVNFGGGTLTGFGGQDIYLAKFNTSGVHQWSRIFGAASIDAGRGITVDSASNVYLNATIRGAVDFGGGLLPGPAGADVAQAKFNTSGVHQWSYRFGSANEEARRAAVDTYGQLVSTGFFQSMTLGGNTYFATGASDLFVAKFAPVVAAPKINSIVDIKNDQGRKVRISFAGSGHDGPGTPTPVVKYEAYRRNDPLLSTSSVDQASTFSREQLLDLGWVDAGSTAAHQKPSYVMDAPTDADSTLSFGQHYSVFFIRGATSSPNVFFDSPPDSGYSKDNLAPGIPSSFVFTAGQLTWDESKAADFDYFTVYGSNTNSFGSATLVNYTIGTNMNVAPSPYTYYFLTATDFSGNEGKPAVVNTLSGVGGTPQQYVLSLSAYPNPFNPQTTLRYTLPAAAVVSLRVYEASGALVATLVNNERRSAGPHSVQWDGRVGNGARVGSGVYFARLTAPSGTRDYKLVLLK